MDRIASLAACAALTATMGVPHAHAAEILVSAGGEPLEGALVLVTRTDGPLEADTALIESGDVTIDQIDREFVPGLRVVRPGTRVSFPNHDDTHHHVYSFSPAKTFELPLFRGEATEPVTFDQVGLVTLGCNIHDWMEATVVVTEAQRAGFTGADGRVVMDLPDGRFDIEVWHPRQRGSGLEAGVLDASAGLMSLEFELALAPEVQSRRPRRRGRDY